MLSSSSYLSLEDYYSADGDGRGGVGPTTTHFPFQKFYFGRDRHDIFFPYHIYCTKTHVASYLSMYYSVGSLGGSLFGVVDFDGKVGVSTRTPHIFSHKVYCWIGGGYFLLYHSRDYSYIINSNKDRSYYSIYVMWYDQFIVAGDGGCVVRPSTTHFSYHKMYFITNRNDVGFIPHQIHCTKSPVVSLLSRCYSDNDTGNY